MHARRIPKLLAGICAVAALAACGGGEVGGELSGMGASRSVTLLNNGSDALTLTRNGRFSFAQTLQPGAAYEVTVSTPPAGQTCTVANGSGAIDASGDSVDDVRVSCAFAPNVRGVVTGLVAGTALTLANGDSTLVVTTNGAFAFPQAVADGTAYDVRVRTQPFSGTCAVTNGSGVFFAERFEDVTVACF
jgi:hypothetical protein